MKKLLGLSVAAAACFLTLPATAHHMAEGIVSDEIYEMIDENLVDLPHLDLDLSTIGSGHQTMRVVTVTVEEEDVAEVLEIIGDALPGSLTGFGYQRESSIDVYISAPDEEELVTIIVRENIGQGESQIP